MCSLLWCEQKCSWMHLEVRRNIIAQSVSFSNAKWRVHLKPDDNLNWTACAYLWLPHTCVIHAAIQATVLFQRGACQEVAALFQELCPKKDQANPVTTFSVSSFIKWGQWSASVFSEHLGISDCKVAGHNGSQIELFSNALWPDRLPAFRDKKARLNYKMAKLNKNNKKAKSPKNKQQLKA